VTFHRAFDRTPDPDAALEVLLAQQVDGVLTAGHAPTALAGAPRLRAWQARAGDRLEVMAGGGVRADHARTLVNTGGLRALHARGTDPTITDAALVLGYLDSSNFLGGRLELKKAEAEAAIAAVADRLGSCATVVNIDPKRVVKDGKEIWEVFVSGGRVPTGLEAVAWAREVERLGAGEIVLTCMDRDGTRDGYDLEITAAVSRAVGIPVVASGGAGRPEHLADAITLGGADAALAAGIFHFGQCTIREVKEILSRRGIPVRPVPG
jgi:NAD(P)H-dependent flavin oxidoreductase YrpB (nitropropane dioxygenase family)